jgi:uncharacterized Zn-finger protein
MRRRLRDAGGRLCASRHGIRSMTAAIEPLLQANAQKRYDVHRSDLPLSCPLPSMALWNSHPRVYMAIENEGGQSDCPYCGAHFVLVD